MGNADAGAGGSDKRYRDSIDERTVSEDCEGQPLWSMGTINDCKVLDPDQRKFVIDTRDWKRNYQSGNYTVLQGKM